MKGKEVAIWLGVQDQARDRVATDSIEREPKLFQVGSCGSDDEKCGSTMPEQKARICRKAERGRVDNHVVKGSLQILEKCRKGR